MTTLYTQTHTHNNVSSHVFTSRCLLDVCKGGCSSSSGIPNCTRPLLPDSHSNSSQQLNPSCYLTLSANSLTQVKVKLKSRQMVNWPICLRVRHPSGAHLQISTTVRQLRVCWWALSLTRGWVSNLQLLLGLASAVILGYESRMIHDPILLSQIWDFNLQSNCCRGNILVYGTVIYQGLCSFFLRGHFLVTGLHATILTFTFYQVLPVCPSLLLKPLSLQWRKCC
jgi:hypothetical protein